MQTTEDIEVAVDAAGVDFVEDLQQQQQQQQQQQAAVESVLVE